MATRLLPILAVVSGKDILTFSGGLLLPEAATAVLTILTARTVSDAVPDTSLLRDLHRAGDFFFTLNAT